MDSLSSIKDRLYMLRLIAEGGCDLLETGASSLFVLALNNEQEEAAIAFDTIDAARHEIRDQLREMQSRAPTDANQPL